MSRLAIGLAVFGSTAVVTPGRAAENTVVKSFSNGVSRNSVGIVDASTDTEIDGPQAIYAGDDGSLYLLDQVNSRVLHFDAKRSSLPVQTLELPPELRPTDIVVRGGSVYVWDGQPTALQASGRENDLQRELTRTRSAEVPDDVTLSAFAQMGSQTPGSPADLLGEPTRGIAVKHGPIRQVIASRGGGSVVAAITVDGRQDGAQIDLREQASGNPVARLRLRVRDRIGAVEFLEIDNSGRMFVLTENIPTSSRRPSAAFVVRFSPQGEMESIYDIPLQQSVALSRRFIAISPDGDVYFLRTRRTDVDVLGVGSRGVKPNAVIDNPGLPRFVDAGPRVTDTGPVAAVRQLTRQKVIETALAFEGLQWQLTSANYGPDPDATCTGFNRIRRPGYLSGKLNQQVRGVPYCWGCHGSLNQFRADIAHGMLAGNVCTHNDPRPDVVGVDCSAFVSAAWGLANHFTTSAIPAITTEVANAWDMQPGDAFNKAGSHVMLFLRFTPDRKAEVMEASTGGCNGRVCRNVYPLASLLARGYRPVRFRALQEQREQQVADAKFGAADGPATGAPDGAKSAPQDEDRRLHHHRKHK